MKARKRTTAPFLVRTMRYTKACPSGSGIWVDRVNKRSYSGTWGFMGTTIRVNVPKVACEKVPADPVPIRAPKMATMTLAGPSGRGPRIAVDPATNRPSKLARGICKRFYNDERMSLPLWQIIDEAVVLPTLRRCFTRHSNGTWDWSVIVFATLKPLPVHGLQLAHCRIEPPTDHASFPTKRAAKAAMDRALEVMGLADAPSS
jgi:hypothetical protein